MANVFLVVVQKVSGIRNHNPTLNRNPIEGAARIWEVLDFKAPPPEWLASFAESVTLAELPTSQITALASFGRYEKARTEALATAKDDAYSRLARSLFR